MGIIEQGMHFNERFGIFDEAFNSNDARKTVKGVAIKKDKILLLQSKLGEYSLPGGGIDQGETPHEALKREVKEETGYDCHSVKHLIGKTILRRPDKYDPDEMYELVSYYYVCEVGDVQGKQSLTSSELAAGQNPVWVPIDLAVDHNEKLYDQLDAVDHWIEKENFVLSSIQQLIK